MIGAWTHYNTYEYSFTFYCTNLTRIDFRAIAYDCRIIDTAVRE